MKKSILLLSLLLMALLCAGCDSKRSEIIVTGIYSQAMEHQGFVQNGKKDVWWVDGGEEVLNRAAVTKQPDGTILLEGKAKVRLRGILSSEGHYGHLGMYPRKFTVSEVIECTSLTM